MPQTQQHMQPQRFFSLSTIAGADSSGNGKVDEGLAVPGMELPLGKRTVLTVLLGPHLLAMNPSA
jgi:hypothetical protein